MNRFDFGIFHGTIREISFPKHIEGFGKMVNANILKYGLFLLVCGLAMVGAYMSEITVEPVIYTIGGICAILGLVLMGAGFLTIVGFEYMPKKGIREGDQNIFSTALLRCMLAISIADNILDDSEVTELRKIYKYLTQTDIEEQTIRDTAQDMMENDTSIETELSVLVDNIDIQHKEKLIIASLYILAADGDMDERELLMLDDIREGLNLSIAHVERVKKEFLSKRDLNVV